MQLSDNLVSVFHLLSPNLMHIQSPLICSSPSVTQFPTPVWPFALRFGPKKKNQSIMKKPNGESHHRGMFFLWSLGKSLHSISSLGNKEEAVGNADKTETDTSCFVTSLNQLQVSSVTGATKWPQIQTEGPKIYVVFLFILLFLSSWHFNSCSCHEK